jgi:hypothetical protein
MSDLKVSPPLVPAKMPFRVDDFRSDFSDFVRDRAMSDMEAADVLSAQRDADNAVMFDELDEDETCSCNSDFAGPCRLCVDALAAIARRRLSEVVR